MASDRAEMRRGVEAKPPAAGSAELADPGQWPARVTLRKWGTPRAPSGRRARSCTAGQFTL
jgi:hypothetical protein